MRVQLLHPNAKVPTRAHGTEDVGFDLYAVQGGWVMPGAVEKIPVGVAIELEAGWGGLIMVRSGHGARGLVTTSAVVDPGYRGELHVVLYNAGKERFDYQAGDRIGQLVPVPAYPRQAYQGNLQETARGSAGFGSTKA